MLLKQDDNGRREKVPVQPMKPMHTITELARDQGSSELDVRADLALVKRCIAGEVAGWEEMYEKCHPPLCRFIRSALGAKQSDPNLVDELAAQVWYALVKNDGELLMQYTPKRQVRLITFIRAVAKDLIGRHFRSEVRRRKRELVAATNGTSDTSSQMAVEARISEFMGTLTPREREFANEHLLIDGNDSFVGGSKVLFSQANVWQLTHRIHVKLVRYLGLAANSAASDDESCKSGG